jgi:hypothetical protein
MAGDPHISVLLGAGASADAGIPTTVGMTDSVMDKVERTEHSLILRFIRGTLEADLARRAQHGPRWPRTDVRLDVERLFAAVDLLIDRYEQPWSPFVTAWNRGLESFAPTPNVTERDLVSQLNEFDRALKGMLSRAAQARAQSTQIETGGVRQALARVVAQAVKRSKPGDVGALLSGARTEMLRSLFDVLRIDDPHSVSYLTPLIEVAKSQGQLTIATLNYDRSVENAAELAGVPCDTAIETWLESGELKLAEEGLQLLKLHGSINWVVEGGSPSGGLPQQRIRKVAEDEKARYDRPAVVFGEGGKLRAEGPFLELLLAWAAGLRRADNLLIIGYSLRDAHVNELIARWFNNDASRRIVLLSPEIESAGRDFGWHLEQIARQRPNQPGEPAPRFVHIAGKTKAQLPEAIAAASKRLPVAASGPPDDRLNRPSARRSKIQR